MQNCINFGFRPNHEINDGWGLLPDPMERSVHQAWWRSERKPGFFFPSYDEDAFWPTTVPGSYQQVHERLEFFEGQVLYRVHFESEAARSRERVFLHFEGVGDRCRVFLNGCWVGEHDGSHTPFSLEVTQEIAAQNRLLVYVECKRKAEAVPGLIHDWFHYGGIHRAVRIYRVPEVFVAEADCRVRLPDSGQVEITLRARMDGGERFAAQTVRFALTCCADGNTTILEAEVVAHSGTWVEHTCLLPRESVALWAPGNPVFHRLEVRVGTDTWSERAGLREVRVEGRQILLNGQPVFLQGSAGWTVDPVRGHFSLGEEWSARTVKTLQRLNANFARAGHGPPSREFVRACDEAGILLWLEVPAYWKPDMHELAPTRAALKCLEEMVAAFRLSPSAILWSIGNECVYHDTITPKTNIAYFLEAVAWLKEHEPSRLITYTGGIEGNVDPSDDRTCPARLMRLLDVVGFNCYAGQEDGADPTTPSKFPELRAAMERLSQFGKPLVLAEAGIDAVKGETGFDYGEERQVGYYRKALEIVADARRDGILQGVCFFALCDFRTPIKLGRLQGGYNRKGITTTNLEPKAAFAVVSAAFAKAGILTTKKYEMTDA
jgi:beta-glucuronidase